MRRALCYVLMLFVQLLRGRVGQQRVERGDVAVPRGLEDLLAVFFSLSSATAAVAIAVTLAVQ